MKKIHNISLVPDRIWEQLYNLRFWDDRDVPYDEYIKRYGFITVEGVPYANEESMWRAKEYLTGTPLSNFRLVVFQDVIVDQGKIIKNRYGKQE